MAISVDTAVITPCRDILLDPIVSPATDGRYWKDVELLRYYNMFVTAVISEKPDALTKPVAFALAAGVDQQLDTSGVQFLRAPANVVSGRGIIQVTSEAMQDADPDWYASPPTTDVAHVIPDERDPLRFRVWPPNDGTGQIWVSEAYAPDDVTDKSQNFTLTEAYRMPAIACVLGMAYSKNTDRGDTTKSAYWFGQFDQRVGIKAQAQLRTQPKFGTDQTSE